MVQQTLQNNIPASQASYKPVAWAVGLGVAFTLAAFFTIRIWERRDIEEKFRLAAEDRAAAVKGAFDTNVAMLDLVRSAVISDGRVERQEFCDALAPFVGRSQSIEAVEWVPRVSGSRRQEIEAAARKDGIDDFQFTELDKDGQIVPAVQRDEYYPIYYIGPVTNNAAVYGLDLGSDPTRFEPLKLARDTGKAVASAQFAFAHEKEPTYGFLVCLPAYEKDKPTKTVADRQKNLMGFVVGVFRPNDMIESALAKLQPEGIDVGLLDTSDPASQSNFHFHASRSRDEPWKAADSSRLLDPKGLRCLVPLEIAGHSWTVVCAPSPTFIAAHRTLWPIGVLVVGLVFTGLLAGHLVMGIQHTANLEEKVREQTADIRSTQEDVLYRLASAAQTRDGDAPAHLRRIAMMSQALAGAVDWLGDDVDSLRQAAPMHDIGKVGIPDSILNKTGALTPEEAELLKAHTRIGADILGGSKTPMLVMAREIALNHHEQWDGKGYPRGLAGKNIPESARIVAIVDAYDTLTHDALNRAAVSSDQAVALMQKESEKRFDPTLLAAFVRVLPDIRRIAEKYPDKRQNGAAAASPATPVAAPIQTSSEQATWSGTIPADV